MQESLLIINVYYYHTFKNSFGSLNTPTPLGVPVRIISPGNNVIKLKNSTNNLFIKIKLFN